MSRTKDLRGMALHLLWQINKRQSFAKEALARLFEKNPAFNPAEKGFITDIVYGTLKYRGGIDCVINKVTPRGLKSMDPYTLNAIQMACYQVFYTSKIPDYAAVNETVRLIKKIRGERMGNFGNKVLRQAILLFRQYETPAAFTAEERQSIRYSFPAWIVERWVKEFGEVAAGELMQAINTPPALSLRVNPAKGPIEQVLKRLEQAGIPVEKMAFSPFGLRLVNSHELFSSAEFQAGSVSVQDEASQLTVFLLSPRKGDMILDACAGLGTKSLLLAQLVGNSGRIDAADINAAKLKKLAEEALRLGLQNVRGVVEDIRLPHQIRAGYPKILLDAPCSGMGVLRKYPEARWKKSLADIEEMSALQRVLLNNCADLLAPQGLLVYSVCSLEKEEGDHNIERFLAQRNGEFEIDTQFPSEIKWFESERPLISPPGYFKTYPHIHGMDGFFAVRLRKR